MKTPITTPPEPERGSASPPHPLALAPYSPTSPSRAPEWRDPDPLALDPYSPIVPNDRPAPNRQDPSTEDR